MLKIAILIPIFNGLDYTKACLKSLYEYIGKVDPVRGTFSIIVVDDASSDGSYEWISSNYPSVELVKGTGSLWWSGAINMGVRHAIDRLKIDYILWWNNDILPERGYFKKLIGVLEHEASSTIIGSKIYLAQQENTIWSMGGIFDPYTGEKNMIGRECKDNETYSHITECDWLPGMGTVIHKSIYNKVGMVDAVNFPQYHGDSDYTYRAKLAGSKIVVIPELKIYNDTRNSGLKHDESFTKMIQSLYSIKSNYNVKKDFIFYRKYAKSMKAYGVLIERYFVYIGGFFKWKLYGFVGIKRNG